MHIWLPVYLLIGFVASIATMFGDLVESCIKRKLFVKDMGDLMPGHGGILDRIDSALYATVAVYAIYALIALIV
jgi:phosphatidate cytidylyltransferase